MNRAVYASSKSDEWCTPLWFFRWCESVWGHFVLDPAATPKNTMCSGCYYTAEQDGLAQPWFDCRVFCNPPYSQVSKWVRKGMAHAGSGSTALFLVPARTDTRWFHDHAIGGASEIVLLKGRLRFSGAKHSAPFPSCLLWFAPKSGLSGPKFSTADLSVLRKEWTR